MFVSAAVFSAIDRVVLSVANTGAWFGVVSSRFVTLIVTDIESLPPLPSETETVTEYEVVLS